MRKTLLACCIGMITSLSHAQTAAPDSCGLFREMVNTLFGNIPNKIFVFNVPIRVTMRNEEAMFNSLKKHFKKEQAYQLTFAIKEQMGTQTLNWCTAQFPLSPVTSKECERIYKDPANRVNNAAAFGKGYPVFIQLSNPVKVDASSFLVFYTRNMPPGLGDGGLLLYTTGSKPSAKKIQLDPYSVYTNNCYCDVHIPYEDAIWFQQKFGLENRQPSEANEALIADAVLYQPGDIVQPFRFIDTAEGVWRAEIGLLPGNNANLDESITKTNGKLVCADENVLAYIKNWKFIYTGKDMGEITNTFKLFRNDTLVATHEVVLDTKRTGLQSRWYGWMPAASKAAVMECIRAFK